MRKIELPELNRDAFVGRYGSWAVIAGASEGTGACFAELLAMMGINLVLVSRRKDALDALAARLSDAHGVECRTLSVDLRTSDAASAMLEATADLDVGLYVSNAGADGAGNSFLDSPVERSLDLLSMNAATLIRATHGFGGRFRTRGRGGIVVMASGAGLGGQPWLVMYSATKAFEINFAESLWAEFEGTGVDIIGVAAPTMDTPTLRRAVEGTGFDLANTYDPTDVVHLALTKLGHEPLIIVPDGPGEENLPQLQADRRARLIALAEWAKAYTQGAQK